MISVEVRSSGPKARETWGWTYPATHRPLIDGRVVKYWVRAAVMEDERSGVVIIIRRAP